MPPTRSKGSVIGTLAASAFFIPEEEEDSILGGVDITPPSINVPVDGLDEEEQVALALKASMDTAREEQAGNELHL